MEVTITIHKYEDIADNPTTLRKRFRAFMKRKLPGTVYWRLRPIIKEVHDIDTLHTQYLLVARLGIGPPSACPYINIPTLTLHNLGSVIYKETEL